MNNLDDLSEDATLRRKAEELLKSKAEETRRQYSEAELLKLVHELDVHQIELEMQNEELVLAKSIAHAAAEKYTELFEFAPTGYFTLSREGLIGEVNLTGSTMLGMERFRIIHTSLGSFFSNTSRAAYTLFLEKLYTSGIQESCELTLAPGNDEPVHVFVTGIAATNGDQCMITMADITKRKKAEEELVAAKEKAMESDRLKTAFLANMSHEIRTPMNGILGFTWMLKQPMLTSEQQQEYISIIEKSGVRMLHIINDILSIAKVEAGQVELTISETNLNAHFDYIRTFFEPEIERKGLRMIVKKGQSTEDFMVMTDGEKFFSILTNIVKNAIKFTNEGSITIGYEMKGEFIEIFVKDTGTGLRKDQKEIIFERFRQGSELLTRNNEGSGLGLAIAKAYVEMLGGKIRVESEEGMGTEFYFTIPFTPVQETDIAALLDTVPMNKEAKHGKLKILIAEDDEVSELYVTLAIKDYSKEVLIAKTGFEAVEVCRNNPDIDLILMDIRMLVMDGYSATRQIREFNKDVIIIAQTAQALSGDRETALKAGCNDYISKPIDQPDLQRLINKYITSEEL